MDLVIKRNDYRPDGIFGELSDSRGDIVGYTLEHAFKNLRGGYSALIPPGTYDCVRGEHYLHGMTAPFWTFEVSGVDGHAGLLFHWGNYNTDSEGCILLGKSISKAPTGRIQFITHSREDFQEFMAMQSGIMIFKLLVIP